MTQNLLPPEEAQHLLEEGRIPSTEIIAHLDLEKCSFGKRVVTEEMPAVRTGVLAFGKPAVGQLAFTPEDIAQNKAEGASSILAVTTETYLNALHRRAFFESAEGMLCLAPTTDAINVTYLQMHLPVLCAGYNSVLIDDQSCPVIEPNFQKGTLRVCGREIARRGDMLTIDPQSGRLWLGRKKIERTAHLRLAIFFDAAFAVTAGQKHPTVAFHQMIYGTWGSLLKLYGLWPRDVRIGLQRTEQEFGCQCILNKTEPAFVLTEMAKSGFADDIGHFANQSLIGEKRKNYRFVDLHGLKSFLPPEIQQELGGGLDHIQGTSSFNLRNSMNKLQFSNAIRNLISKKVEVSGEVTITFPNVANPKEVWHLFKAIRAVTPSEISCYIKRGVMIENKEVLRHAREIAFMCDSFCLGWGDMTASITGLSRGDYNHREWMAARGYAGNSPNDVLVSEVLDPVAAAVCEAKRVNATLEINACGHQTSWGHVPSLRLLLRAIPDIDMITVYPSLPIATITQLAIAQHHARRTLGLPQL